jgi:serine/threonine-protein kinase
MSEHPAPAVNSSLAGPLSGRSVGRFLIGVRLGKGGMGEVYRAEDTRLKRSVALKRLSPSLRSDPTYRHRFQEEAERASRFSDAHVAAVYDVLEENDEIFLVMEFVEGQTLRQRLRQPMSLEEFLAIAVQCAEALVAAHDRGIVHCDIKPENIMINTSGQVKILDFGVAKHLPRSDQSSTIDRSGTVGGTPAYMSPEVLLERIPDGRADIFSLGIVLYEALAGRHPFLSDSYVATTHRILHEVPTALRVFNPKVSEELGNVVNRALAKDPAERYPNARDLLDDLRAVQVGVTPTRFLPVARRRRKTLPWISLAIGLVAVGLVILASNLPAIQKWLGLGQAPVTQVQLAILPFTPSADDANSKAYAQGLTETLTVRLAQLTGSYPLQIVPPREVIANSVHTAEQARKTFGVNMVLEGNLRESNNMVRVSYSLVDAVKLTQKRADTVTVETSKPFDVEDQVLASIVTLLGLELQPKERAALRTHSTEQAAAYDYYLRGRGYLQEYHKPENLDAAVNVFTHALERDPNYALAYAGLGEAYLHRYEENEDSKWIDKALQSCQRAVTLADNISNGHICLGNVDKSTGKYEDAVKEFQRAIQQEPMNDDALRGLGSAYEQLEKFDDAEQTYKRAIQLRPQYFGGYAWLGAFYYRRARYEDAALQFTEQIAAAPDNFRGYSNLGAVYLNQGLYANAIHQFQRAVALQASADAYSNLATAYFFQGNYDDAAETYERAVQLSDNDYLLWGNLAEAYYWSPARRQQAANAYKRGIALAHSRLTVNNRDASALYHLALFHAMLQQRTPSLSYLEKALQVAPNDAELQFTAAKVYAQLGMKTQAIDSAEKAIKLGYLSFFLRDDPVFKSLAKEVQFQKLVQPQKK